MDRQDQQRETDIRQYLTFKLGDEQYAVEVEKVQEVLEVDKITKVPRTPQFMRGVINRRGTVLPVIDLRLKFGMSKTEKTIDTGIIVFEINMDDTVITLGALADSVQEVIDLESDNIEPPPKFGTGIDTEFIKGMGKYENEFLILLDIDRIFSAQEISQVSEDFTSAVKQMKEHAEVSEEE